jgi:hypothetical protein
MFNTDLDVHRNCSTARYEFLYAAIAEGRFPPRAVASTHLSISLPPRYFLLVIVLRPPRCAAQLLQVLLPRRVVPPPRVATPGPYGDLLVASCLVVDRLEEVKDTADKGLVNRS